MGARLAVAAAQLGPVHRKDGRTGAVARMVALLERAAARGCRLVVFPEMALTPFFPRRLVEDPVELDGYFEPTLPGPETEPLFAAARDLGTAFFLGYCERDGPHRYNSAVLVDGRGEIVGRYRKVHLPGNTTYDPGLALQHLEKLYFEPGDEFPVVELSGWRIGLCLCNDRRWPETYRVLALGGADLVALGYNTPANLPDNPEQAGLREHHHLLPMQAAAYQNGLWVVAAGKAGREEGCDMMGASCVVAPSGEVAARAGTLCDELVIHTLDRNLSDAYKRFHDIPANRRPECYGPITAVGPTDP